MNSKNRAPRDDQTKFMANGQLIVNKVIWNLDVIIMRVVEESVARGINLNNTDHSEDKEEWRLEEDVAKVIEVGRALGIDFNGKEQEMIEIISSKEKEDEEKLKKAKSPMFLDKKRRLSKTNGLQHCLGCHHSSLSGCHGGDGHCNCLCLLLSFMIMTSCFTISIISIIDVCGCSCGFDCFTK
ncbi:hypothetical protein LWI28_025145 [Acer negundo]|uniref:Uncharacterized protein n=1 Tax=Acer negundo TaxID=4023 RepID=A0AAD5JE54_ACENE|nr:hypothetical protein LWI28_025145 [Acer negundo]